MKLYLILCLILVVNPASACSIRDYLYPETELSYCEFWNFVNDDMTSDNLYIRGGVDTYICVHFATDLAQNLTAMGYDAGVITITAKYHGDSGHMITWCEVEGTLYAIEAGNDHIMYAQDYNESIDQDSHITKYESLESGERKANEMYQRLI